MIDSTNQGSQSQKLPENRNSKDSRLENICKEVLGDQRLIIVSNRGPVTYEKNKEGKPAAKRGSGGVVTALISLTDYTPVTWVAAALSEADREIADSEAQEHKSVTPEIAPNLQLRFVSIDEESFDKYLNVISNPLLWFVQHEMDNLLGESLERQKIGEAWSNGYVLANQKFAQAVIEESGKPGAAPYVVFHDYQLYLTPGVVRQQRPDLTLLHFTHIPWPEPETWRNLPLQFVRSICEGLLACDIVGFQTSSAVEAFAHTCQEFLEDLSVEESEKGSYLIRRTREDGGQITTVVNAYPISVDPDRVRETFQSQAARQWHERLSKLVQNGEKLIVRVDRVDPNKNIITGFEAYEKLLKSRPELRGKVNFLALLVPTRESVPEYAAYKEQTFTLINEINQRYGNTHWEPVHFIYGNDYGRALAGLSLADVVLVNSLADGMNLVAKEASVVNQKNSVLILSQQAGAWEELSNDALGVDPTDTQATAQTLYQALEMPAEERAARAERLAQTVEENDLSNWLAGQLLDLQKAHAAKSKYP